MDTAETSSRNAVEESSPTSSGYPKKYGRFEVDWVAATFITGTHAVALLGIFTFSWQALLVCVALHWVTGGLGITLGFHRLLTHRSFKTPKFMEYFLALMGTLACQGGPITWVTAHRLHHAYSDQEFDPHSPLKSFFWAHMGWCLRRNPNIDSKEAKKRLAPDLAGDRFHQFLDNTQIVWTILLASALYAAGGWPFVIWGIFVRLVFVYHCTWLVNSAAHVWGYRTYEAKDQSTNLWWVALLTYGEGWHNNHHAFQTSARHGLHWWEFDSTYLMIRFMRFFGLAQEVKIPTSHQLSTKAAAV